MTMAAYVYAIASIPGSSTTVHVIVSMLATMTTHVYVIEHVSLDVISTECLRSLTFETRYG